MSHIYKKVSEVTGASWFIRNFGKNLAIWKNKAFIMEIKDKNKKSIKTAKGKLKNFMHAEDIRVDPYFELKQLSYDTEHPENEQFAEQIRVKVNGKWEDRWQIVRVRDGKRVPVPDSNLHKYVSDAQDAVNAYAKQFEEEQILQEALAAQTQLTEDILKNTENKKTIIDWVTAIARKENRPKAEVYAGWEADPNTVPEDIKETFENLTVGQRNNLIDTFQYQENTSALKEKRDSSLENVLSAKEPIELSPEQKASILQSIKEKLPLGGKIWGLTPEEFVNTSYVQMVIAADKSLAPQIQKLLTEIGAIEENYYDKKEAGGISYRSATHPFESKQHQGLALGAGPGSSYQAIQEENKAQAKNDLDIKNIAAQQNISLNKLYAYQGIGQDYLNKGTSIANIENQNLNQALAIQDVVSKEADNDFALKEMERERNINNRENINNQINQLTDLIIRTPVSELESKLKLQGITLQNELTKAQIEKIIVENEFTKEQARQLRNAKSKASQAKVFAQAGKLAVAAAAGLIVGLVTQNPALGVATAVNVYTGMNTLPTTASTTQKSTTGESEKFVPSIPPPNNNLWGEKGPPFGDNYLV